MSSNIKVLQVIPTLGYGGAETGCYDIAHYLSENNCKSFIVTSGGEYCFLYSSCVDKRVPGYSGSTYHKIGIIIYKMMCYLSIYLAIASSKIRANTFLYFLGSVKRLKMTIVCM